MKALKSLKLSVAGVALMMAALFTGTMATTQPTYAACNPSPTFLTFPTWYRGLVNTSDCTLTSPGDGPGQIKLQNYIWVIVLNVIEIALQLIAYLTVFMVIYGGFLFMTNGGESGKIATARKTIITALIGLAISSASIGVVNLLFNLINP